MYLYPRDCPFQDETVGLENEHTLRHPCFSHVAANRWKLCPGPALARGLASVTLPKGPTSGFSFT